MEGCLLRMTNERFFSGRFHLVMHTHKRGDRLVLMNYASRIARYRCLVWILLGSLTQQMDRLPPLVTLLQ